MDWLKMYVYKWEIGLPKIGSLCCKWVVGTKIETG